MFIDTKLILVAFIGFILYFLFVKYIKPYHRRIALLVCILIAAGAALSPTGYYMAATFMAFCYILFTLTVVRDLCRLILQKLQRVINTKNFNLPSIKAPISINGATVALTIVVFLHSFYEGAKTPELKVIKLSSPKITKNQTIVFISDTHISRRTSPDKVKNIVDLANAQSPDFILLGGDIFDEPTENLGLLVKFLSGLKAKNGIYFVTGNHEPPSGRRDLQKLGFTFVENKGLPLSDGIFLAGIPYRLLAPKEPLQLEINKAFEGSKKDDYRILLSHAPVDAEEQNNFDIELAGHTHGGQVFPCHLFTKLFNQSYLSGFYKMTNNAKIYVSRGAGQWAPPLRFLAPSEITVVKLVGIDGGD